MKQNHLIWVALAFMAFATGCRKDKASDFAPGVRFTSSIFGQVATRVTGNAWDSGDAIGVFMKQGTGLTNVLAANKHYSTPGNGNFMAINDNEVVYFPASGNVDFIAYYPYRSAVSGNKLAIDVSEQNNQAAIDVLYSDNATGLNKGSTTVNLDFMHRLAKVELNVDAGAGTADLVGLTVTFRDIPTTAEMDLATGEIGNPGMLRDVDAKVTVQGDARFVEAILVPDDFGSKEVVFTLPSGSFTWTLPANTRFDSGKKTTYTIFVQRTISGPEVAVAGSATISDWTTIPVTDPVTVIADHPFDPELEQTIAKVNAFAKIQSSFYFYNMVTEDFSAAISALDTTTRELSLTYKTTPDAAPTTKTVQYEVYTKGIVLKPAIAFGSVLVDSIELGTLGDVALQITRAGNAGAGQMGYMHLPPYAYTNTADRSVSTSDWLLDPAQQNKEGSGTGMFMYTADSDSYYSDSVNFHRSLFRTYFNDHVDDANATERLVHQVYFPENPSTSRNIQISTHGENGGNKFFLYGINLEKNPGSPSSLRISLGNPSTMVQPHQNAFDTYLGYQFPDDGVTVVPVIVGTTTRLRLVSRKDSRFWAEYVLNRTADRSLRFD